MIAARVTPRVDEIARLRTRLQQLEQAVPDMLRDKQAEFAEAATTRMKDKHGADAHDIQRYVNRTWDLTESIGFNLEPTREEGSVHWHPMRVFAATPYAYDVENGVPGKSRPYPFFWQELTGGPVVAALPDVLTRGLHDLLASVAERA